MYKITKNSANINHRRYFSHNTLHCVSATVSAFFLQNLYFSVYTIDIQVFTPYYLVVQIVHNLYFGRSSLYISAIVRRSAEFVQM